MRTGQTEQALQSLTAAVRRDSRLAQRAASDIEFARLAGNTAFGALVGK